MNRIVLGDCLSILPTLPDRCIDLVLTDPPYLLNYQGHTVLEMATNSGERAVLRLWRL